MFTPPNVGHAPGLATVRDVTLIAGGDLLAPWIDQFNIASADATKLLNSFYDAPNVGLQQFVANQSDFIQQVLDDPSNITGALGQMQDNLAAVLTGYGLQNATDATTTTVLSHTLDDGLPNGHSTLFAQIPGYIPADEQAAAIPIINFLASPASGIIMGALGPFISPWVALMNSISDGDDLNTTLANMVGASFNGATLSLNSLLPTINSLGLFPQGMAMVNLDIGFGGLLSPGAVGNFHDGVGGSIFNSVGINLSGVPTVGNLEAPSQPIGPIGAWEAWGQTIASLLGWSGSGSPLADTTLPVVPDDTLDVGSSAAAMADPSDLWQSILALF